jgi:hypothetical protein
MILTFAYSSSFGISCAMKVGDSKVIIQSKEKRTRSGCLYVTSIYLYAITISYYSIVRYKNIDNISILDKHKIIGFKWARVVGQLVFDPKLIPLPESNLLLLDILFVVGSKVFHLLRLR